MNQIEQLSQQLENASPQEILAYASDRYGPGLAIVTSFQVTGIATLHMMQAIAPATPALTLDTGFLFPETIELMSALEKRFGLTVKRVKPRQTPRQQARDYGDRLWERHPDRCCHIRKTMPLRAALSGYDAWIAGLRRDQSPERAGIPIISHDARNGLTKIAPFANWSEDMIWSYIHEHDLPYNALHDKGYPSIGCWTCTAAVTEAAAARSGRWSGRGKSECGIHIAPVSAALEPVNHG